MDNVIVVTGMLVCVKLVLQLSARDVAQVMFWIVNLVFHVVG